MFVQIMRLEMTWRALRRNHTETAVLFEKKLKPFMNLLNDGDGEGRRFKRDTLHDIKFIWQMLLSDVTFQTQEMHSVRFISFHHFRHFIRL